jgi:hypothetical protein
VSCHDLSQRGNRGSTVSLGVFIIAGETVRLGSHTTGSLLISPKWAENPATGTIEKTVQLVEGKHKPVRELFAFEDLWESYGLDAILHERAVKLSKVASHSRFAGILKQGDVIVSHDETAIHSIGQLRRLFRFSVDKGELDFQIDRSGEIRRVRAALPKR